MTGNSLGGAWAALNESVEYIKRLLSADELLHHGGIVAGATVLSGGLNYVFQMFMGRMLGPEQYGMFGALFALFYLISVLGSGIRFSASRFTAELIENDGDLGIFHLGLVFRSLLFGFGISALVVLASPVISQFLQLSSVWPVVIVAGIIPFVFTVMANMGSLEGLQLFALLGAYTILRAGVKLIAGIALVLLGYGLYGAFTALGIAAVTAVTLTTLHVRHHFSEPRSLLSSCRFNYEPVYKFAPPAILAGFCLTVPANVDVIFVRHYFTGEQAGLYTAASVLGKGLIFFPLGISTALFPKVTSDHSRGDDRQMHARLHRALLYTAITAGTGALLFWLMPAFILELLFGSAYVAAAPLVQWYGIAILGFVLVVVILNFELARDGLRFVYVFAIVTVVEIGLMWTFHGSMIQILQVILFVNTGQLAYGFARVKR